VATKKTPAKETPKAKASKTEATASEAQAAADKILDIEAPDQTGKEMDPEKDNLGDDFLPGTLMHDVSYIPKRIDGRNVVRKEQFQHMWVGQAYFARFHQEGWRFSSYEGRSPDLVEPGFENTGLYEKTLQGRVQHGDSFLMYLPRAHYNKLKAMEKHFHDHQEAAAKDELHNEAYKLGVRSFEEVDGKRIDN